jgi:hypothetical protein
MNIVELSNWYVQPIHCPFCGGAFDPHDPSGCKHLLYVIFDGDFQERSDRFDEVAGLAEKNNEYGSNFTKEDIQRYGTPGEIVDKVSSQFRNLTEFQVDNVSDTAYIGFANLEEEFCGWGLDHKSPYGE